MPALYSHTTRATGTVLTATIYNGDHQNHIDNGVPGQLDDYSNTVGQMQTATDPGGVGSESLATSLAGELERIRFILKRIQNGAQWYGGGSAPAHSPIDVQVFTSSGTWTKPAGCTTVFVRVVGGGGGGGGAPATPAGQYSHGGGGGSGGYSEEFITSGLGATETVTIGAGGTGTSGGAGNGGGTSSFGAHLSATGGTGGQTAGPASGAFISGVGNGGSGSGGGYNVFGQSGMTGFVETASGNLLGGAGGPSVVAGGASPVGGSNNGANALAGSGGGGGGASNQPSQGAKTGGTGGAGVVIVRSYT